jgi:hypothetical protein
MSYPVKVMEPKTCLFTRVKTAPLQLDPRAHTRSLRHIVSAPDTTAARAEPERSRVEMDALWRSPSTAQDRAAMGLATTLGTPPRYPTTAPTRSSLV